MHRNVDESVARVERKCVYIYKAAARIIKIQTSLGLGTGKANDIKSTLPREVTPATPWMTRRTVQTPKLKKIRKKKKNTDKKCLPSILFLTSSLPRKTARVDWQDNSKTLRTWKFHKVFWWNYLYKILIITIFLKADGRKFKFFLLVTHLQAVERTAFYNSTLE